MKQPDLANKIDIFGRMMIAHEEIEVCQECISLIPEVRTNMVFAHPDAKTPDEVMVIDGRITIINGVPRAAGRVRFGTSSHMARLIIELMKTDPSVRAGIDFANPSVFQSVGKPHYCSEQLPIGVDLLFTGISPPYESDFISSPVFYMPVQTVGRDIETTPDKPLCIGMFPFQNSLPRFDPLKLLSFFFPEPIRICKKVCICFFIITQRKIRYNVRH